MERLVGEVDLGLKIDVSKKIESPLRAVVSSKPIPSGGTQVSQELNPSVLGQPKKVVEGKALSFLMGLEFWFAQLKTQASVGGKNTSWASICLLR